MQSVLITGGAGFIGQNLVHAWRGARPDDRLTVVDAMTYAANVRSLEPLIADRSIEFVKGDIGDAALMQRLFDEQKIYARGASCRRVACRPFDQRSRGVSADQRARHVHAPEGGARLLARRRDARQGAIPSRVDRRSLWLARLRPIPPSPNPRPIVRTRPYAASKASSDHLVRAFVATYGMPALITNCSNNYGAYQHPEKLIPLMIIHALEGKPLPVYGDGSNVRDWLHVSDHCAALMNVIERGRTGETYNVGGGNERNNREVVGLICDTIDAAFAADARLTARFPSCPAAGAGSSRTLITYVTDRPGHDHRYAIDAGKLATELGSRCSVGFERGLQQTVQWYIDHEAWWRDVTSGAYQAWIDKNYGFRRAV